MVAPRDRLDPENNLNWDLDGHRFDSSSVSEIVRKAVREGDGTNILHMAQSLRRKDLGVVLLLVERLAASRHRKRRQVAAVFCGAFATTPTAEAAETILRGLIDDSNVGVASRAVDAMGRIGCFTKPEYIDRFADHPDFVMRWARQSALISCAYGFDSGVASDPAALDSLIRLIEADRDETISSGAAFHLGTMFESEGSATPAVAAAFRRFVRHSNPGVRKWARYGLRKWRKREARERAES